MRKLYYMSLESYEARYTLQLSELGTTEKLQSIKGMR